MVTAQAIDTSLSDADTTAAASFLQGRLEPAPLEHRYQSDLATAASSVAAAAQEAGTDPRVAGALRTLSTNLPVYSAIVQEADFNERQQWYPLAAAYISEANNLMRTRILPAAAQVYGTEGHQLSSDQSRAIAPVLPFIAAGAFFLLLVVLVGVQSWLGRRFRRRWNVALVLATVAALGFGLWAVVAMTNQENGVTAARQSGSRAVSTFTQARILALRARADDELTLLTRDSDPTYQQDYTSTEAALTHMLNSRMTRLVGTDDTQRTQLHDARSGVASYEGLHRQIRRDDLAGDLPDAITLASGSGPHQVPATSADLDHVLTRGIDGSQISFDHATSEAATDLNGLAWGLVFGLLVVLILLYIGFRPRLEEYR